VAFLITAIDVVNHINRRLKAESEEFTPAPTHVVVKRPGREANQ
jgi:hypothetical protein